MVDWTAPWFEILRQAIPKVQLVTNTYIYSESCQRLFDLHDLDLHWHSIATFLGPLESTEIAGCSSRRMTPRMDSSNPLGSSRLTSTSARLQPNLEKLAIKKKPARLANGCGPAKIPFASIRVGKLERTHNTYLRITSSWKRDGSNMHTFCFPCWAVSLVSHGGCYENEMPK